MVVLAGGEQLTLDDVPDEIKAAPQPSDIPASRLPGIPAPQLPAHATSLAETEKEQILATLAACGGNKSKAAVQLGISRRTLHRKLNEWSPS